jgi:hypothetical protein
MLRVPLRLLAMATGITGAVLGFVINMLYSLFHVLGRIAGITADSSHFFIGTGLAILAGLGAILLGIPELAAALMLIAGVGFFFVMGWWAIIPAIFLFPAALFAYASRSQRRTATAS